MLFIRRLLHAAIFYIQFSTVLGANRYWISEDCNPYPHVKDALDEAIWVSGRVENSIGMKEPWLNDLLVWFFATNVHSPATSYIRKTFSRIAALQPATSQLEANLRIHCDNDRRFEAVDSHLNTITKPQPGTDQWSRTRFYDRQNQIIVLGNALSCGKSAVAPAYCMLNIEKMFKIFSPRPSLQLPDRHVITLCDVALKNQSPKKPWTWRGFANRKLENVKNLPSSNPLMSATLLHEMVHVSFLSEQTISINTAEGAYYDANGRDYHPINKADGNNIVGYYLHKDILTPGEMLTNPAWTVMNPDSYAYLATIYRLRDKRWEAYRTDAGYIRLRENVNLQLKGDWPNAPPDVEHK